MNLRGCIYIPLLGNLVNARAMESLRHRIPYWVSGHGPYRILELWRGKVWLIRRRRS